MQDDDTLAGFRAETRAWLEANCPPEMRQPMAAKTTSAGAAARAVHSPTRSALWLERMAARGWTVPDWPKRIRRRRALARTRRKVLREEMARARAAAPPLSSFGIWMLGPALLKYGTEAAEARAPAEDRARRDPLVPGLFRARRRLGPRLAADARRGPRRPLRRQRPEDLDLLRRQGRLDLLPRAHRPDGQEARGHQLRAVRHGDRRASRRGRSG